MHFNYLIEKVRSARVYEYPFPHIHIKEFFEADDFAAIVKSPYINIEKQQCNRELIDTLFARGYKVEDFPGSTRNYAKYLEHQARGRALPSRNTTASEGLTLRLYEFCPVLRELNNFITSRPFNAAIASRFDINLEQCRIDAGIQKYLDGYEISPHPDVRLKAATFMVNINPHTNSETQRHHTTYLRLKPEYRYVQEFWENHLDAERQWIPWDWCESVFTQNLNNSIVIFAPGNDTLHAVKAHYNHLLGQRTQLYGNLWYIESKTRYAPSWEQLSDKNFVPPSNFYSTLQSAAEYLKKSVRAYLIHGKTDPNVGTRKGFDERTKR